MRIRLPAFAQNGETLSGEMSSAELVRGRPEMKEVFRDSCGTLVYRLVGGTDAAGGLFLAVELSARVWLECRRCLERFEYPLTVSRRFWVRGGAVPARGAGGEAFGEAFDEELEGGEMALADFLGDELLLSLPAAPAHPRDACAAATFIF